MRLFEDYIYEVRGCNDPIDGDVVKFETKVEAFQYADMCPDCTVYMVEVEEDPNTGCITPTGEEMQLRGPEADAAMNGTKENSCEGDQCEFTKEDLQECGELQEDTSGIQSKIRSIMDGWDISEPTNEAVEIDMIPNRVARTNDPTHYRPGDRQDTDTYYQMDLGDYTKAGNPKNISVVHDYNTVEYDPESGKVIDDVTTNEKHTGRNTKFYWPKQELTADELRDSDYQAMKQYRREHPDAPKETPTLFNQNFDDMTDEELAEELYKQTKGLKEELSVDEVKSKLSSIMDTWDMQEGCDDRRGHDPVDRRERVATDADDHGLVEAADEVEKNVDGTIVGMDPQHDAFLNGITK